MADEKAEKESKMTATERRELRSLVRQHFKLLRNDVLARKNNIVAEAKAMANAQVFDADEELRKRAKQLDDICRKAKLKADILIRNTTDEFGAEWEIRAYTYRDWRLEYSSKKRDKFYQAAYAEIQARTAAALADIDRQELAMLREIAEDAVTSVTGREFLSALPALDVIMPAVTAAEIEAKAKGT